MKRLLSIGVILMLAACFCLSAMAEDGQDVIRSMTVDAEVESDGGMLVVQTAQYNFQTSGNGFYIDFDFVLDGGVEVEEFTGGEWRQYTGRPVANNGSREVYTLEGGRLKIYYPTVGGETPTFRITYRILHAAQRYRDTAEIYWQVIPEGYDFPIGRLDVSVATPAQGADMASNKVWGHSPAAGEAAIVDENHFSFFAEEIRAHEMVEIRALFSPECLPDAELIPEEHLAAVLEQEEQYIKADHRDRAFYILSWVAGVAALAGAAVMMIVLYFRYDREYSHSQKFDYYRELPEPYPPAEAAVLIRYRKLTPDDVTATLMDLARREYVIIEDASAYVERYNLSRRCGKEELVITATTKPREGLAPHEAFLLDWLLRDCGDGAVLFMDDLKDITKKESSAQMFLDRYKAWQAQVLAATAGRDYFDDQFQGLKRVSVLIGALLLAAGILSFFIGAGGPDRMGGRQAAAPSGRAAAHHLPPGHQTPLPLRGAEIPRVDGLQAVSGRFQQYEGSRAAIPRHLGTLSGVCGYAGGRQDGDPSIEGPCSGPVRSGADHGRGRDDDPYALSPFLPVRHDVHGNQRGHIPRDYLLTLHSGGRYQRKRRRILRRRGRRLWRRRR